MQPKISIIIPTYNRASYLGDTLDSIIAQTYKDWECIVVDDGSSDNTFSMMELYCEKDSRIQFHHRPEELPKGANSCRNYGFKLSNGDFVNWFDSDDVMLPDFIQRMLGCFDRPINFAICSGYYVNDRLKEGIKMPMDVEYPLFKGLILGRQIIITNSVIIRKAFLQNLPLFNPEITRGQETEFFSALFYKIDRSKYKILDEPLFLYRQHKGSKTSANEFYNKSYKESLSFIGVNNLDRSIQVNDSELIRYYYKHLMTLFFQGIENKHPKNSSYIYENLLPYLKVLNKRLYYEFSLIGRLLLLWGRSSYRLSKRFREAKIL